MTPDAKLQIFAVKRGMIKNSNSFSPEYFHPERLGVIEALKNSALPIFLLKEKVSFKRELIASQKSNCHFLGLASVQSNTGECIDSEEKASGNVFKYKSGDVLYCRLRPYLNKVYLAEESGVCSTEFHVMKPKDDSILSEYLAVIMRSKLILHQTKHMMTGNTHPRISNDDVKALIIPVPNREVQQEIVTKFIIALKNRSKKLQQAEELLAGMDEFVLETLGIKKQDISSKIIFGVKYADVYKSRIDAIFNNPHFVTRIAALKELPHDSLENIIEFSDEVWNGKDFFEDVFPYIEISNIGLKNNIWHSNATSMDKIPSRAKMVVRNGDIIVSTTRPHRGAIAMLTFEKEQVQIASTGFSVLRNLKRSDILKEYLYWVLLNDYVLQQMLQRSSGGNYPAINQDELKKIIIPIPSIDKQKKIIAEAERRKKLSAHLKNEAEKEWQDAREQFEKELLGE